VKKPTIIVILIALVTVAALPASATAASIGQLYAFGWNRYGQLGIEANSGTGEPNPIPALVSLPGGSGEVAQIAASPYHSLAVTSTGQFYAFGRNSFGELGSTTNNGTEEPNPTPALVTLPGASGPVTQIAASRYHSLAVTSTGQLYAFGLNKRGQLGNATNNDTEEPNPTPALVTLPGASGPVTQIAAGGGFSLASTSTGQLYAFGINNRGQLGISTNSGTGEPNPTPALVTLPGASGPVTQIAAGGGFSLASTSTGQLYGFGNNRFGQLGSTINNETEEPNPTPALVTLPGASGPVTQIAAGDAYSLVLTSTGQLFAFGVNREGQLGSTINNETYKPNPTPALVTLPGASGPVTQIAAGTQSLALTSTGQLYGFGNNHFGQLGSTINNGTENPNPMPALVLAAGTTINTMVSGTYHALVVIPDLTITSESLSRGQVGTPYSATVKATGGISPYSWQASGLPFGLSIDAASGQISGTPTVAGTTQVQLSVSDHSGNVAESTPLTLSVDDAPPKEFVPMEAPPTIIRLRQSHLRWRRGRRLVKVSSVASLKTGKRAPLGTTFTFRLNENARVKFSFARRVSVRKKGHKGLRFRKAGVLTFTGHRGENRVKFQGRISRRKRLKPGRYRLTATATSGGMRSKPQSLRFMIIR
jgi:alpha-tubulin suppressor-like RCC1 family protein